MVTPGPPISDRCGQRRAPACARAPVHACGVMNAPHAPHPAPGAGGVAVGWPTDMCPSPPALAPRGGPGLCACAPGDCLYCPSQGAREVLRIRCCKTGLVGRPAARRAHKPRILTCLAACSVATPPPPALHAPRAHTAPDTALGAPWLKLKSGHPAPPAHTLLTDRFTTRTRSCQEHDHSR